MTILIAKLTLISTVAATVALAGCATNQQVAAPTTTPGTAAAQGSGCTINSSSAPLPTAEEFRPVPPNARVSVTMTGIPSGEIKPGDPPVEVDVTLCNDSPVDYPNVGVTTVLTKCSCATTPMGLPQGHIDRLDPATGQWVPLTHPVITTGMDFLGGFTDVQPLPKGKSVTLKYRVALDPSMTSGKGSIESIAVVPDSLVEIGKADLPFTALNDSPRETPVPPNPQPTSRQSVLPFTTLTYPRSVAADKDGTVYVAERGRVLMMAAGSNDESELPITLKGVNDVAVDGAGNVYVSDFDGNRVLRLTTGSNDPTALPFTGLDHPQHIAVDSAGDVYVTDRAARVVKLTAGSSVQTVIPLRTNLTYPDGVGVDGMGDVYVADSRDNQVVKIGADTKDQRVLSIGGLDGGFAVDATGNIFVGDNINRRVLKRAAASTYSTELPFSGLNGPQGVAVDGAGNVYVIDNSGFGRIVKMAAS